MNHNILKDENLQGREKENFTVLSVMKFFKHIITYWKLIN